MFTGNKQQCESNNLILAFNYELDQLGYCSPQLQIVFSESDIPKIVANQRNLGECFLVG